MTNGHPTYGDMEQMFAYGQPKARLWSVGLEEYCTEQDLPKRMELRRRAGEYVSLDDFHLALYGRTPRNVSVWDVTLQIYERLFGTTTKVGGLDAATSDILLAEILPLPRPGHDKWPGAYRALRPDGPDAYIADALPRMANRLIRRVREHKPHVVLLHGKTEHRKWIKALGSQTEWRRITLGERRNEAADLLKSDDTIWALTNNFVNNGYVTWGGTQIGQLADEVRKELNRD